MPDDAVLEPEAPDLAGLAALPAAFGETREGLHRLAEQVLSPVQAAVNGDIHFRWTPGGFGTPRFGEARQLRVEGATVVAVDGEEVRRAPITSLREAAAFVGADATDDDKPLAVDDQSAIWLGDFYGFAFGLLEQMSVEGRDPAPIRLWPEHFDIATDVGDEAAGTRATVGASPGDAIHPEPYLYVLPWTAPEPGSELWQANGFVGAELNLADLLDAEDQRAAALEFFRTRLAAVG